MTYNELIDSIATAIARMEGFFKPNSLAARNNNPGNLRSWGKNPIVAGYAKFPTEFAGWLALRRQIYKNIERGLTLYEFFGGKKSETGKVIYPGYAPAADNNYPRHYAEFVSAKTGCPPDVVLLTLIKEKPNAA